MAVIASFMESHGGIADYFDYVFAIGKTNSCEGL